MFQVTHDERFLHEARHLTGILETFSREREGRLVWLGDGPRIITADYSVGYSGVAMCLLRLGEPDTRPHSAST